MSMLYLASFITTSAVRLSGRSAASRSRRVLAFHCAIVSSCLLLLPSWFSTVDGRWDRAARSLVPVSVSGDGRSGVVHRAVVHFMEAASKKCWSAAGLCKLLAALSLSLSPSLPLSLSLSLSLWEQIEVSNRQEHVKRGANYLSLQWLVERCWEFYTSTALDAATVTSFSG